MELIRGHVYKAKKPRKVGVFDPLWDDRQILWVGLDELQYDSPSVKIGKPYPRISIEKFLKWAGEDITAQMPADREWRRA